MRRHRLEFRQVVPASRREVFAFFSDARNLERLTPPFLRFRIDSKEDIAVRAGTRIDYRLTLHGLPIRWKSLIERYEPEHSFVDVQISGPYRSWRHLHEFLELPNGTEIRDRVDYALPLGPFGELAHLIFVKRSLQEIFAYRHNVIADVFR